MTRLFSKLLENSDTIAQQRHNPALMFLNHSLSVLYMNQEARHLIRRSRANHNGNGTDGGSVAALLPREILVFAKDLRSIYQVQPAPQNWDRLQLQRVIALKHRPLLIRGFALPPTPPSRNGYLLILVEPIILQRESRPSTLPQPQHFTPRERSILRYLVRGHSNRDIAYKLGISIHTVKEHFKAMMLKTQTTTRTGILAHVLTTNGSSSPTKELKKSFARLTVPFPES